MKKRSVINTLLVALLLSGFATSAWAANSVTTTIIDPPDNPYGADNIYGISSMNVNWNSNDDVVVDVYTAFAGKSNAYYYGGSKILYGDLMISTGSGWDYAFHIHNKTSNVGGDGWLIDYANSDGYLEVQDYHNTNESRKNTVVAVDHGANQLTAANQGSWSVGSGVVSFSFNVSSLNLSDPAQLAFRWAMTCANDIISGVAYGPGGNHQVPEPAILALFLSGLVGFGVMRKRSLKGTLLEA
ncbi:PEP-CTERM sorting domain-containing protein [Sedimenticola selenatireducens]|uniref:PEP-CTERM sorting domain-containing protein n=1 Tax=Sedimenticola selenatireducens TaxID=191960 RepID=A0A557S7V7_9GAMM|nr:PEP-CTERM sorting domain-containing protein [Sedimenticola selenatireducens]TVO73483.1 PEP-CTERM sorting domain-containing protein [Sedimenticola selenatireducens]TVT63424.1 MAG: PEP-CTERM sorting domain-containing protein [Sedimenticola selenatireducens]